MTVQSRDASSLKRRINSGESILGVTAPMSIDRDGLESILEKGPYDFVWVDGQHSPFNEETLVSFCSMAAGIGVPALFRVKHTRHAYLAGVYLDLGPSGIEVPQVELESTVDEAIQNFYYPPLGVRSWGGSNRLGLEGRRERNQYGPFWNETGVLWIQLESIDAVSNARSLAKQGVDCLSFGPMDLRYSLEAHPHHPFKTVDDCVRHVVEQLRDTSVAVLFRNNTPDTRDKYRDMGVSVLLESP